MDFSTPTNAPSEHTMKRKSSDRDDHDHPHHPASGDHQVGGGPSHPMEDTTGIGVAQALSKTTANGVEQQQQQQPAQEDYDDDNDDDDDDGDHDHDDNNNNNNNNNNSNKHRQQQAQHVAPELPAPKRKALRGDEDSDGEPHEGRHENNDPSLFSPRRRKGYYDREFEHNQDPMYDEQPPGVDMQDAPMQNRSSPNDPHHESNDPHHIHRSDSVEPNMDDPSNQVRTLFITGLPIDLKEREIQNLFRFHYRFEGSSIRYNNRSHAGAHEPVCFAAFETREEAQRALNDLRGIVFDPSMSNTPLRVEFARSNTKFKRHRPTSSGMPSYDGPLSTGGAPPHGPAGHHYYNDDSADYRYRAEGRYEEKRFRRMPSSGTAPMHSMSSRYPPTDMPPGPDPYVPPSSYRHQDMRNRRSSKEVGWYADPYGMEPVGMGPGGAGPPGGSTIPIIGPSGIPVDQTPCSTLFVGNLGMNTTEDEITSLFSRCSGFKRCRLSKGGGGRDDRVPVAFVEYTDTICSTQAMQQCQNFLLSSCDRGGIRIEFAKNRMGTRSGPGP